MIPIGIGANEPTRLKNKGRAFFAGIPYGTVRPCASQEVNAVGFAVPKDAREPTVFIPHVRGVSNLDLIRTDEVAVLEQDVIPVNVLKTLTADLRALNGE
ncbi:hypothetical protein GmRootV35_41730 [Variovorax sp. V35]